MTITIAGFAPVVRLGPNPDNGRDLVVGDVHGHFATLRHALSELEVGPADRLFSLGDLIDRGPDSFQALSWLEGKDPSARFDLVIRGNHEQLMLVALGPHVSAAYEPLWPTDRGLWYGNGGRWWEERGPDAPGPEAWTAALAGLPFAARIDTPHGPVGLVHACPVHQSWEELEKALAGDGPDSRRARMRALWSRIWHRFPQSEIGEDGREYAGPVEGVRAVVTGHTPVSDPAWHWNVLDIDTGIIRPHLRRLTVARIDTKDIGTWTFERVPGEAS